MRNVAAALVGSVVAAMALESCGYECIGAPDCSPPLPAMVIRVSAPDSAPVDGAAVEVLSPFTKTVPCNTEGGRTTCDVFGGRGVYTIRVSAAGYQSVERRAQVGERLEKCSCPVLLTQHLDVVLPRNR